jgi:predicted transcriptional regulator
VANTIGDQELALCRFVAEQGPISVGEAAERFGVPRGWARSTVLTVMERLRAKKRLTRRRANGVYVYASREGTDALLSGVVRSFVETTLSGSVSPFVAYLSDVEQVSDAELVELERLVKRLRSKDALQR